MQTETAERPTDAPGGAVPAPPRPHDLRRKRPPALAFLLRAETLRRAGRVSSLLVLDLVGIFAAIFSALMLKALFTDPFAPEGALSEAQRNVAFAYLITVLLFARAGLYSARETREGLPRIITCLAQGAVIALVFALVNDQQYSSYFLFYGSVGFASVYIPTLRWGYGWVTGKALRKAGYRRRALLVGRGEHIEDVHQALGDATHSPIELVGFISLTPRPDNGLRSLGQIEDLAAVLDHHRVQEVIIADPKFPQDLAVELVDACHRRGVTVRIAPSTMELLVSRAEFVPGSSVPLFELRPPVFDGLDYAVKRTFDVLVCATLVLLLSPLLVVIALAVAVSSRGGIIYRSVRPGLGAQEFRCFKFRTMYEDADQRQADLESLNEASGPLFKIRDDPRMTPVGRVLRRFSLDELPQLFNVLLGQMSLVGPRPLPQRDYEQLEDWHKKRYLVLPGITGLWQVSGRSDLDFDDLVRLDFLYLERWSVFLDLTILLKTVPAVLAKRGAY